MLPPCYNTFQIVWLLPALHTIHKDFSFHYWICSGLKSEWNELSSYLFVLLLHPGAQVADPDPTVLDSAQTQTIILLALYLPASGVAKLMLIKD